MRLSCLKAKHNVNNHNQLFKILRHVDFTCIQIPTQLKWLILKYYHVTIFEKKIYFHMRKKPQKKNTTNETMYHRQSTENTTEKHKEEQNCKLAYS